MMSTRLVQSYAGAEACRSAESGTGWDDPCLASLAGSGDPRSSEISFPGAFVQRFDHWRLSDAPADSVWRSGVADHTWVEVCRIHPSDTALAYSARPAAIRGDAF